MADYSGMDADAAMGSEPGYGMDTSGMDADAAAGPADWGGGAVDWGGIGGVSDISTGFRGYDSIDPGYSLAGVEGPYSQAEESFGSSFSQQVEDIIGKVPKGLQALARTALGRTGPLGQTVNALGTASRIGNAPDRGPALGHFAGLGLSIPGAIVGGPIGAMASYSIGNAIGSKGGGGVPGYSGPAASPGAGEGRGGMDLMTGGLGLLGTLYANSQNSKGIGRQMRSLQEMYGQNSPYAQAMRQQLERRDAAAGRRSQYGPREVELQAALAGQYSRNAPTLMNLQQLRMQQRNQTLAQLAGLYQQMGGMQGIRGGLNDLFNLNNGIPGNMELLPDYDYGSVVDNWQAPIPELDFGG